MTTTGGTTSYYSAYGASSTFLSVVSQTGSKTALPASNAGWAEEISLDVEWAHAIAPGAKIILVEANSTSMNDLLAADKEAVALGANVVSNSWGGGESSNEASFDKTFSAATGVTFVFSAGDSGNQSYPATSPDVLSVGGTTLNLNSSGTVTSETAWSDGGGGVSKFESKPSYQNGVVSGSFRSTPDVSFDANPNTGVAVYDTFGESGWSQVGGTSVGAPAWSAILALADGTRISSGKSSLDGVTQTLPALYTMASSQSGTTPFYDVTSGGDSVAKAGVGYDAATGLGTPRRTDLIYSILIGL